MDNNLITNPREWKYYKDGVIEGEPAFGLYDTIGDRFLIVLSNEYIAKYLKYILSSRYNLHICRLDQATNYVHGMITNENCETWSLTNRSEIRFSVSLSTKIVMVRELCAPRDPATYDIDTEKFWCQFCSHYLHRIYEEEDWSDHYSEYRRLDEYLNSFLNITQVDYVKPKLAPELRNQVLKILYTSRSFDEAADRLSQVPMCV